jgi:hypothetical protein
METKMNIKIEKVGEKAQISSPYNPDFVKKIKAAGGKWSGADKVWEIDARAIETAREICRDVYGADDTYTETVTLRVETLMDMDALHGPVVIAGRAVASAKGRDSGARIGDGVSFAAGKPTSGGSVKNWRTVIRSGAVIDLFDIPLAAAEKEVTAPALDYLGSPLYTAKVVKDQQEDTSALLAERERLMARLSEIDALIGDAK